MVYESEIILLYSLYKKYLYSHDSIRNIRKMMKMNHGKTNIKYMKK